MRKKGLRKNGPQKTGPRKIVAWKKIPGKMVPWKKGPRKKKSPETRFPKKCPQKIVVQKNARKFKRLFYFCRLIPLHTQKYVRCSPHDPSCTKL